MANPALNTKVTHLMQIVAGGYAPKPKDLAGWSGVAANTPAHVDITTGPTIQRLEFITNYTDVAKIPKIRLELNGTDIVSLTGEELKSVMNGYIGLESEAGRFIIDFAAMECRTQAGVRAGELVTLPSDKLTLHVEFGEVVGTAPTIRSRMFVTPAQAVRRILPRLYSTIYDASSSGDNDWFYRNGSVNRFIRRMHMRSADLTYLKIERDGKNEFEATAADNAFDLGRYKRNPLAGVYTFDPVAHGFGLEGLFPTHGNELKFILRMANAGSVPVVIEEIEQKATLN